MTTFRSAGVFETVMVVELTKIWTPPCSSIVQFEYYSTESCAPPAYTSVWYDYGYYSPGICPSGYTSGCKPTTAIDPGQTAAVCVPRGWKCSSDFILHAFTVENGNTISAPAFQIRWEASDLPNLETDPLSPLAQKTDPDATGGGSPPIETGSTPDNGRDSSGGSSGREDNGGGGGGGGGNGMSRGAVAGIAVGVAAVVTIVFLGLFLWYRKRHLPKAGGVEKAEPPPPPANQPPTVYTGPGAPTPSGPQEMDAKDAAKSGAVMGVLGGLGGGADTIVHPASPTPDSVPVQQLDGRAVPGAPVPVTATVQQLDGRGVVVQHSGPPPYAYAHQLDGTPLAGPQPAIHATGPVGSVPIQYPASPLYAQQLDGRPTHGSQPGPYAQGQGMPSELYSPVQAAQMPPELSTTNQEFINMHQHPSELHGNNYYAAQQTGAQQMNPASGGQPHQA